MYCGRMFLFLYRFCSKQFSPAAFNLGFSDACEFCVLNCFFLPILTKIWTFRQILWNFLISKFHENFYCSFRVIKCGQTDMAIRPHASWCEPYFVFNEFALVLWMLYHWQFLSAFSWNGLLVLKGVVCAPYSHLWPVRRCSFFFHITPQTARFSKKKNWT